MQFEFAGALAVADGRYLIRESDGEGGERVLIVQTLGAPPAAPLRRRQRTAEAGGSVEPAPLPLARVTAVRAFEPFASETEAAAWLERTAGEEEPLETLIGEGIALVNRALHAHAAVSADPALPQLSAARALRVRIGYGSGEELAAGRFSRARDVGIAQPRGRRRRREEELRPQERVAAVLAGRDRLDACETLLLRVRSDLDNARPREAALQLTPCVEALLVELDGALVDPRHGEDMEALAGRREEAAAIARTALRDTPGEAQLRALEEIAFLCERIVRRRRILRG